MRLLTITSIGVEKRDIQYLLSDLVAIDGDFLKPNAKSIEQAAVQSLLSGDHVLTGRLVISVHTEKLRNGKGYDVVAGVIDPIPGYPTPSQVYASYGEEGTENPDGSVRMQAWPYMGPAARAEEPRIKRALEKLIAAI